MKVLNEIAGRYEITLAFTEFPWGSDYYFEHGEMMPDDALDTLAEYDQIYLGAGWASRTARPRDAERAATPDPAALRSVCLRASERAVSGHPLASCGQGGVGYRHRGHPGEHGGRVRQRRGIPVQGVS